ncbi:MAG: acylphosphatase, partial [Chthoniobacterales bacterium]
MQGVGFRPFVYRLAEALKLRGWVVNSAQGVFIEIEGEPEVLAEFARRLPLEKPARAILQSQVVTELAPVGDEGFAIRESTDTGAKSALILPDLAPCADCLREIFDP